MKIQTKFFLVLILLSVIMGAGTIIPGYMKLKSLELSEAKVYSIDKNLLLGQDLEHSYEVLSRAGVLEIASYVSNSKEAFIQQFESNIPEPRLNSFMLDSNGKILAAKGGDRTMTITSDLIQIIIREGAGNVVYEDDTGIWHVTFQNQNHWGWYLVTGMSEDEVYKVSWAYLKFVLSMSVVALIPILLIYLIMSISVRRKFMSIVSHLENYKSGRYEKRIPVTNPDEIGFLENQINSMIENIDKEINARKKSEKALESAKTEAVEANRAKTEFLANMSHEIRNPLNAIVGFSEILSNSELSEKQTEFTEKIVHASQNLTATLTSILDITRIEHGMVEPNREIFEFREEIYTTFDLFSLEGSKKGLEMICDIDDEVPEMIYGDKLLCSQIVTNLIQNAVKFTSIGGITLNINLDQENDSFYLLKLDVIDTGTGMTEKQQKGIFDMFSQVQGEQKFQNKGSGLGLAIVNGVVEILGGTISVVSKPGQGTTFSVTLPFEKVDRMHGFTNHRYPEPSSFPNSIKVLIVEDDTLNRDYIAEILTNSGVDFVTAKNGREAIEHLEIDKFDLVLMDIRMPEMNGDEAIFHIRQKLISPANKIPIIVLTASAFKNDVKKYIDIGATSYLVKPFESNTLLKAIRKLTVDINPEV